MAMNGSAYPVHVDGRLDPRLSRGLWLVKWLLAIPHYLVLALLWLAFGILSVVAFFAILVTGRYPHAIFDFNVGVLRWQWRVSFYAFSALGTDRYPPFTLDDVPDYPAHLFVDYPEHLSRGLVLVKWWLLAIPHYLVLALLLGGAGSYAGDADARSEVWGVGLIGLLTFVAGVVLLFTGRYPTSLFDLLLGLNRWVLRVAGYAALMTDTYPPLRLDQGGEEPGTLAVAPPTQPEPTPTPAPTDGPPPPVRQRWTTGRVVSVVAGCLLVAGALATAAPAVALIAADQTARDDDGFLMSRGLELDSSTYAITSGDLQLHTDAPPALTPSALIGDVKLTATGTDDSAVFVGVGPAADVQAYLDNVAHATIVEIADGRATYRTTEGGAPTTAPSEADVWAATSEGTGTQSLTWTPEDGDWTVLVMNDDASQGVDVTMTAGAEVPAIPWVIGVLLTLAAIGLALGALLIAVSLRAASRAAG
jgi:Domain of unknown function (DUF4389)